MSDVVSRGSQGRRPWRRGSDDRLSLAGLLNVLDGVVDSPGRIVIMTSNHPRSWIPRWFVQDELIWQLYPPLSRRIRQARWSSTLRRRRWLGRRRRRQALMKFDRRFSPAQLEHCWRQRCASAALLAQSSPRSSTALARTRTSRGPSCPRRRRCGRRGACRQQGGGAPSCARFVRSAADLEKAPCGTRSVSEARRPSLVAFDQRYKTLNASRRYTARLRSVLAGHRDRGPRRSLRGA